MLCYLVFGDFVFVCLVLFFGLIFWEGNLLKTIKDPPMKKVVN